MWSPILKFLNFFGVITNAFLVATYTPMGKDKSHVGRLVVLILFEVSLSPILQLSFYLLNNEKKPEIPMFADENGFFFLSHC